MIRHEKEVVEKLAKGAIRICDTRDLREPKRLCSISLAPSRNECKSKNLQKMASADVPSFFTQIPSAFSFPNKPQHLGHIFRVFLLSVFFLKIISPARSALSSMIFLSYLSFFTNSPIFSTTYSISSSVISGNIGKARVSSQAFSVSGRLPVGTPKYSKHFCW